MTCKLPDEILLSIQDHLFWPRQPNLLLVSRRFYRLFLPRLYHRVNLEWGYGENSFIQFVRTALRNPRIAYSVYDIQLPEIHNWVHTPAPEEQDISELRPLVQSVCDDLDERQQWGKDLQLGSTDAWAALLLAKLENLRSLHIASIEKSKHLRRLLARAQDDKRPGSPVLQHLEVLSIGSRGLSYPFDASEALPFFQLPSLRLFTAATAAETLYADTHDEDTALRGISGVRSLRLDQCGGSLGMRQLITACAGLESFEYQHQDLFAKGQHSEDFVPAAFYAPLLTQKHSLTKLRLNDMCPHPPFQIGEESLRNDLFGSLADFTALKEVRIRLPNLIGERWDTELVDLLPPTLEKLYLVHCWDRKLDQLIAQLERMVAMRDVCFLGLKELHVQPFCLKILSKEEFGSLRSAPREPPKMSDEEIGKFCRLRAVCEQAGTDFFIDTPQFMATMSCFLPWMNGNNSMAP